MSRRKQARPKSCKSDQLDGPEEDEVTSGQALLQDGQQTTGTVAMTTGDTVTSPGSGPSKDKTTCRQDTVDIKTEDTTCSETDTHGQETVVRAGENLNGESTPESVESKELRCESCGTEFESLDRFMDHRNFECGAEQKETRPSNWLYSDTASLPSASPSSLSTSSLDIAASGTTVVSNAQASVTNATSVAAATTEAAISLANTENSGGNSVDNDGDSCVDMEVIDLDNLDPSDVPFVIGVKDEYKHGCTFCEKAFATPAHLQIHEQTHTAQMPYKCSYCPRLFRHKKSRERHERLHSADRKYKCKVCGVGYSRSDHLRNHMKSHDHMENDQSFKCAVCMLTFMSASALTNHLKTHKGKQLTTNLSTVTCQDCNQSFASDDELRQHACPMGQDPPSPGVSLDMKCPVCFEGFSTMDAMCQHLLTHSNLVPDTITDSSTLDSATSVFPGHEDKTKNTGVLDPESKSTNSDSSLTNSAALVCPYCLLDSFETLESLELHLTSVHNVKPTEVYTCNYCNAPYPNLYSQHGLDITYPCSMCVQRFHSLDALAKHKGIIHAQHGSTGIDAAFCNRCNMTLASPRSLEDHMATVHNIIMDQRLSKSRGKRSASKIHKSAPAAKSLSKISSQPPKPWMSKTKLPSPSSSLSSSSPSSSSTSGSSSLTTSLASQPKPTLSSVTASSIASASASAAAAVMAASALSLSLPYSASESTHASNALRITALLAQKASTLTSSMTSDPNGAHENSGLLANGLTCDHCNATFHDVQNFSAHILLHSESFLASASCLEKSSNGMESDMASSERDRINGHLNGNLMTTGGALSTSAESTSPKTKLHECFKCKATFASKDQLEAHMLLHYLRVSTEYGCSSCAKNFSKPDELQRHLMDIHAHHLYRCSLCKEIFDSKVNIQVHFAIKHSDECKLFRCLSCDLTFRSEMEWQVHVRVNHLHISRPYRCLFCQESFTSEVELQCHLTTHSKPFTCPMCSQAFHIEYLLDQHLQQHHGDIKPDMSHVLLSPSREAVIKVTSPAPPSPFSVISIKQERDESSSPLSSNRAPSTSPKSSTQSFPKIILKAPKAPSPASASSSSNKISQNGVSSSLNQKSPSPAPLSSLIETSSTAPAIWKNAELLHMCNICDVKFCDLDLLTMHKAQDHGLKALGRLSEASEKNDHETREKRNYESILFNNQVLLSALTKSSSSSDMTSHGPSLAPSTTPPIALVTPATPVSCMFCSQTFKNNMEYDKHMKIHVNSGNLTCSICDETFPSASVLAEHKLTHCKIQQGNTCVVCRVTLSNQEQFYIHSQEHGFEGTQLQCVVCCQSLSSLVELQMHGRHHFQQQPTFFTCCVCLKSFESKENLVSKLNSSGRSYYVCKPCYHGEAAPLHTCSQCSEKFATAQLLEAHMLTHKSSFQCIKCQQSFSSECEIQLHVATHMLTEGSQHDCRLCGASFDTPARLQTHLIQHNFLGTDITCFVCKKKFESPQEIQVHALKHEAYFQKFSCSVCPQRFFFSAELDNHKLTYGHGIPMSPASKINPTSPSASSGHFHSPSSMSAMSSLASLLAPSLLLPKSPKISVGRITPPNDNSSQPSSSQNQTSQIDSLSPKDSMKSSPKTNCGKIQNSKKHGTLTIPNPHSSSRFLECSECHKHFTTGTALANHRKTHSKKEGKNQGIKCSLCDQTFSSANSMQQHFFSTHSDLDETEGKKQTFECMVCGKECTSLKALQNHIMSHRTKSTLSCVLCDKTFTTHLQLNLHAQIHQADPTNKNEMEISQNGENGGEEQPRLPCPVCSKEFHTTQDIDDHIKTHEEVFITQGTVPDASGSMNESNN